MAKMNFSNKKYREIAFNAKFDESNVMSPEDAFMLLIHGLDRGCLDNLVQLISDTYDIDKDMAYIITQDMSITDEDKKSILSCAYECIKTKQLGTKMTKDGKFNVSDWLAHSLNVSIVCATLAKGVGANEDVARTLGMLHDYGRKVEHTFSHTTRGFETLVDIGYQNEAIACLTHSYVHGGRCANNEVAYPGFALDKKGDPYWEKDTEKDDMIEFLERYQYTIYDQLLTIGDLTATSKEIVNPCDRIKDIATRRKIDPTNRVYFLTETITLLEEYLKQSGSIKGYIPIKATKDVSIEEAERILSELSEVFMIKYHDLENSKSVALTA